MSTFVNGLYGLDGPAKRKLRLIASAPTGGGASGPSLPTPPVAAAEDWQACHFPDKGSWKQALRPRPPSCVVPVIEPPAKIPAPKGDITGAAGTTQPAAPPSDGGSSIGSFFSSIPRSYLLIGGVIAIFVVLKKR